MAVHFQINFQVQHFPDPSNPGQVISQVGVGPHSLFAGGVVIDMTIGVDQITAQAMQNAHQIVPTPITTKALLDTGCTITSIDTSIVQGLSLNVRGFATTHTAAGPVNTGQYFVSLGFPGTNLNGKTLHQVQLVNLLGQPFKILIGRDLMSAWSIHYNGPAGFISIAD